MRDRSINLAGLVFGCLLLAGLLGGVGYWGLRSDPACPNTAIAPGSEIGGAFSLISHEGVRVSDKDVITGLTLIYFGYSYCPDVCPLDLSRNARAVDLVAEEGLKVTPVFITIDPARDTVPVVAEFVSIMHPDMIGLTGSEAEVDQASKAYKTYYARNGEGEDYLVDHSSFSYLMHPEKGLLAYFRHEQSEEAVAEGMLCVAAGL